MPSISDHGPIAERIAELRSIQATLSDFRQRLHSLPAAYRADIAAELRSMADGMVGPVAEVERADTNPATRSDDDHEDDDTATQTVSKRMVLYFISRRNQPATAMKIATDLGAPHETVRSQLYKRNRGRFVQAKHAAGGKPDDQGWQLSDELFLPLVRERSTPVNKAGSGDASQVEG